MIKRKTSNTIAAGMGTSVLWALWIACLYYVMQDLRSGRFRTYMEADFWAVAGSGATLLVAALLAIVVIRSFTIPKISAPAASRQRTENEVLGEIFGMSAGQMAQAKDMKNLEVNFTGGDLKCELFEVKVSSERSVG